MRAAWPGEGSRETRPTLGRTAWRSSGDHRRQQGEGTLSPSRGPRGILPGSPKRLGLISFRRRMFASRGRGEVFMCLSNIGKRRYYTDHASAPTRASSWDPCRCSRRRSSKGLTGIWPQCPRTRLPWRAYRGNGVIESLVALATHRCRILGSATDPRRCSSYSNRSGDIAWTFLPGSSSA